MKSLLRRSYRTALAASLLVVPARAGLAEEGVSRAQPWPPEVVKLAESLPIQDGGRIKPLHTYASFTLLRMNGIPA